MVTAQTLRQLLHYDPETGKLTWKSRDTNSNAGWNARYAGKEAGSRNGEGYWQIGAFGLHADLISFHDELLVAKEGY